MEKISKELSESLKQADLENPYQFNRGDIVWHTNFKCKCEYRYIQNIGRDGRHWHKVKLPVSGGFMDTQNIERYDGQDLEHDKNK